MSLRRTDVANLLHVTLAPSNTHIKKAKQTKLTRLDEKIVSPEKKPVSASNTTQFLSNLFLQDKYFPHLIFSTTLMSRQNTI